jgi:glucosylglycerate synthase
LAEESILSDDFIRELMNVGEVDILIGVPTYNDAGTVGHVVQAIRAGLLKYFPRKRTAIINPDGGSRDTTQELVRAASISDMQHSSNPQALRTLHSISTTYGGGAANSQGLYAILAAADLLHSSACAIISADSTNIDPDWIPRLLQPVCQENFDLVTPVYRRHKFDGLLVRNLVYPMTRALYSKQVREPYPSEFACSGRLASHLFGLDIWAEQEARPGAELCFTISAITGGFKLAQTFLGDKPRVAHPPADLVTAMREGVGPLFASLEQYPIWAAPSASQPVPVIGGSSEVTLEPLRINRKRLYDLFKSGVAELEPILTSIVSNSTLQHLQHLAATPEQEFCYSNDLWARTVYEFAAAHHKVVINRDHIIQALAPLYRGKMYTFLVENRDAGGKEVERNVENLCVVFEQLKPYLGEIWNGGK